MARTARRRVPQLQLIEDTVNSSDFRRGIASGLYITQQGIYQGNRPTNMEGYVGQNFYMEGIRNIGAAIVEYGFRAIYAEGQHRLVSESHFGRPVTMTLHSGYAGEGAVYFNWEKGPVYRRSILENSFNYWPLQPSLFDRPNKHARRELRQLNLGIVHSVSPRSLRAWIFLGTKWTDKFTIECPVIAQICNRQFEDDSIPDLEHVDDTSDYGVSFAERATGT